MAEEPPSPPILEITPKDILSTRVRHDGKRSITFQKLDPEAMALQVDRFHPVTQPTTPLVELPLPSAVKKPTHNLMLGAGVLIPDPSRPEKAITFLQLWPTAGEKPITLWTNANFLWLTNLHHELETETAGYSLIMMASETITEIPPNLNFPETGKATLILAEGQPTEEQLAPIDLLLEIYNRDQPSLRAQYEIRRQDAAEQERRRALDPPEKKDLIIRYWRTDSSTGNRGGAAR